jgi:hypothetical protein
MDKQPTDINYEAFDSTPRPSKVWTYLIAAGFGLAMAGLVYGVIQAGPPYSPDQPLSGSSGAASFSGLIIAFASIVIYARQKSAYGKSVIRRFLADNGWRETAPSKDDVATSLIGIGHGQKINQAFAGSYHGLDFTAVVYEYATGSGRSETTHYFTDLHFNLKQQYPLIVLDNRQDEHFSFLSSLPTRIPDSRELQLEGNFNERYKVSVLSGTEQEVLQVLTPDFMAELMDGGGKADIELEANKLFVIRHLVEGQITKPILEELFMAAAVVIKNLGELADTWQASSSPVAVQQIADTALSARQNIRVKPKYIGVAGLIGIGLYLLGFFLAYIARR